MFCPYCGSQLNDGSIFCSTCGSKLDDLPGQDSPQEVTAAPGGMPMAGSSGDEMPSIGGAQAPSPVSLRKSGSDADSGEMSGITPPPFPGTNSGNPAAGAPDFTDFSGVTPPPFPGTGSGNPAAGAPDFTDFSGVTPPPFPGTNSGNPAGIPGQYGAPANVMTEIPPEFGQPQPEVSAVRPVKRSKLPLIIVLIVLGVLIAGGALTYVITLNNGTLYRIGGVQKIYDLTHLCVQHHYIDADCENPDRCEICGSEKGEALGHDWTEATCTTPRTCSVCGKTEGTTAPHDWTDATCTTARTCSVCGATDGSPLGHTTGFGTCTRCGEKITDLEDKFYDVLNAASDGDSYFSIGYDYMLESDGSAISYYSSALSATYYFSLAKDKYSQAADLCGSYPEFAELKRCLNSIANYLPTEYPDYTVDSVSDYVDAVIDASYASQDYADVALELLDLL